MASVLSSQSDDEGGGVDQRHLPSDGRSATERGALEMKEQKDATKEAFDGTAFA